jgi:hypothetical protein
VELSSLDDWGLLRCVCGGRDFRIDWYTHVRVGTHRPSLVRPTRVFSCARCGVQIKASSVTRQVERKETV